MYISGTRSVLYDLSQSYFKFECVVMKTDGTKTEAADISAPINFPGIKMCNIDICQDLREGSKRIYLGGEPSNLPPLSQWEP